MGKNVFCGGHFEFLNFGAGTVGVVLVLVVPTIFEISIPKTPLGQSFMLLSGSAHQFHISAPLLDFICLL